MFLKLSIPDELYPHKLAVVLGKGLRYERLLQRYPTERRFKEARLEEIGQVIGIKNLEAKTMRQLSDLDTTYSDLTTLRFSSNLSLVPAAQTIMGIDTEYLLSPLDSIQFVISQGTTMYAGLIFTNAALAPAVLPEEGVGILREVIRDFRPDVIVGHNFNCDITVLERAYRAELPELRTYDDTMRMARKCHVANIIGSAALKKLVQSLFQIKGLSFRAAYEDMTTFIEYGLMDAVFPIYLRHFFLTGQKPDYLRPVSIDYQIHPLNNFQIKYEKIHFPDE